MSVSGIRPKIRAALLATAAAAFLLAAHAAAQQLSPDAKKKWIEYQQLAPHKAFALAANGEGHYWAGASAPDPGSAVERSLSHCRDVTKTDCRLFAVNNVALDGRDWRHAQPTPLPMIGRIRPEPYWHNRGPHAAAGIVVWSHGYKAGVDSTNNAPQGEVMPFVNAGYDLYRFDRLVATNVPAQGGDLALAIGQAKRMGYRRAILAGQSNGAWTSIEAALHAPQLIDGVISISAAHHGEVKDMKDPTIARRDWQDAVRRLKPGPRIIVFFFKDDSFDVGGRDLDARAAFKASGVDGIVVGYPPGFTGHGAGGNTNFPKKYGGCIYDFIEKDRREAPCI